ncbi:hypothetical protein B0T26DRAFT_733548 [Lasiosphaeria miniovina]|uniref:Uncharacterized protein n=1 Tax=Lasiosphaeria miniovina TaxID=1954250 RepID=A0AA39ZUV6_9PEZI|nr:uncharacterized protein B0T26DRAFT_733548 [Lasiosphaeria miniovina]KAK0703991.1 hypothetical protein B0T26DRAFT_733548 [Lasiosphaeria miniovina]
MPPFLFPPCRLDFLGQTPNQAEEGKWITFLVSQFSCAVFLFQGLAVALLYAHYGSIRWHKCGKLMAHWAFVRFLLASLSVMHTTTSALTQPWP